jgi:hypothetical protein
MAMMLFYPLRKLLVSITHGFEIFQPLAINYRAAARLLMNLQQGHFAMQISPGVC